MKNRTRILLLGMIFLVLMIPYNLLAQSKLVWDAPNTGGDVETYSVYWRTSDGIYCEENQKDNITETECPFNSLGSLEEETTYYFVVRAINSAGESDDSNEVFWTVPDTTPPSPVEGVTVE